jgi:hypothetical protein
MTPADFTPLLCTSRAVHLFWCTQVPTATLVRDITNWVAVCQRVTRCKSTHELNQLASQLPQLTSSLYPVTARHLVSQLVNLVTSRGCRFELVCQERCSQPFHDNPLIGEWIRTFGLQCSPRKLHLCGFWSALGPVLPQETTKRGFVEMAKLLTRDVPLHTLVHHDTLVKLVHSRKLDGPDHMVLPATLVDVFNPPSVHIDVSGRHECCTTDTLTQLCRTRSLSWHTAWSQRVLQVFHDCGCLDQSTTNAVLDPYDPRPLAAIWGARPPPKPVNVLTVYINLVSTTTLLTATSVTAQLPSLDMYATRVLLVYLDYTPFEPPLHWGSNRDTVLIYLLYLLTRARTKFSAVHLALRLEFGYPGWSATIPPGMDAVEHLLQSWRDGIKNLNIKRMFRSLRRMYSLHTTGNAWRLPLLQCLSFDEPLTAERTTWDQPVSVEHTTRASLDTLIMCGSNMGHFMVWAHKYLGATWTTEKVHLALSGITSSCCRGRLDKYRRLRSKLISLAAPTPKEFGWGGSADIRWNVAHLFPDVYYGFEGIPTSTYLLSKDEMKVVVDAAVARDSGKEQGVRFARLLYGLEDCNPLVNVVVDDDLMVAALNALLKVGRWKEARDLVRSAQHSTWGRYGWQHPQPDELYLEFKEFMRQLYEQQQLVGGSGV